MRKQRIQARGNGQHGGGRSPEVVTSTSKVLPTPNRRIGFAPEVFAAKFCRCSDRTAREGYDISSDCVYEHMAMAWHRHGLGTRQRTV